MTELFDSSETLQNRPGQNEKPAKDAKDSDGILGTKSPGVLRVEAISQFFTLPYRIMFFFGIFLIAYVYGLDGQIRGQVYQVYYIPPRVFILSCSK